MSAVRILASGEPLLSLPRIAPTSGIRFRWNTSANKVYRREFGGRRVPLSKNEDASKSEAATADAPPTTLMVDGGPSTAPPGGSGVLYLG